MVIRATMVLLAWLCNRVAINVNVYQVGRDKVVKLIPTTALNGLAFLELTVQT